MREKARRSAAEVQPGNVGQRDERQMRRSAVAEKKCSSAAKFQHVWWSERRHGTKDDQHNETADLSFLSFLLEEQKGSYCQSDKAFQSLINNSKNKRHKSCLPKHLCFPRKSKFIETKSSACSTLFFQTGILLRPKSTDVFHLSLQISWVHKGFFFSSFLKHSKSK